MTYSPWDMLLLSDANQYSNFQSFLDSVTPKIPSKPRPKVRTPILDGTDKETMESFSLSRLWEFYTERSYFGNGVPILLKNGDGIVQYYCPSLSALQVYTRKPPTSFGKGSALKQESNSWSDESENDELSMSQSNNSSKSSELTSDDSATEHDALSKASKTFGFLYCEFNETCSPYQRVPFAEKIKQLAKEYPDLLKFQTTDLSPYSWMAVAWYPIYQIPLTKNEKELSACFVTYHALSAFKGVPEAKGEGEKNPSKKVDENDGINETDEIGIPPFAVTTYKMNGELWKNPMTSDEEKIASYLSAASSWLKLLNFYHHDFDFFMSRRSFR